MNDQGLEAFNAFANNLPGPANANIIAMPAGPLRRELPAIKTEAELTDSLPPEPAVLVHGLIHQGSKTLIGGGSKAKKTWILLDLAFSVSRGIDWLGCPTTKGPVLFLNFEVQEAFIARRILAIKNARGALPPGDLSFWNLRGHACAAEKILPPIINRVRERGYVMIIVDPIYKLTAGRDENSAGEVGEIMNSLETIAVETGAAVVLAAHFSKGNQAAKEALDRVAGSGVYARDPDTILPITQHAEEDAYVVEPILRNFPPVEPFVVRFEYPLMQRAPELDPKDLKRKKFGNHESKPIPTIEQFMELFPERCEKDPQEAIRSNAYITAEFKKRGWDNGAIAKLRIQACEEGLLRLHRGAHNRQHFGRPLIMEAWEEKKILSQMTLPSADLPV